MRGIGLAVGQNGHYISRLVPKGWMETVEIATNLLSLEGNRTGSLKRLLVLVLNDLELSEATE